MLTPRNWSWVRPVLTRRKILGLPLPAGCTARRLRQELVSGGVLRRRYRLHQRDLGRNHGIISGASGLPEKWTKPLNDQIVTMCIDKTSAGLWVPQTATQLAERILRVTPGFLGADLCDAANENGYVIHCDEGDALYCRKANDYLPMMNGMFKDNALSVSQLSALSPFVSRADFPAFWSMLDLGDDCYFVHGKTRKIKVTVYNTKSMCQQQWVP